MLPPTRARTLSTGYLRLLRLQPGGEGLQRGPDGVLRQRLLRGVRVTPPAALGLHHPFGAVPFPPRCQLATDNKSTIMPCNWSDNDHFDTSIGPDSSASPASDTAAENAPLTGKARNKTPNRRQVNARDPNKPMWIP